MTIDINQLWSLLTESQLVKGSKTQELFDQFTSDQKTPKNPESLAHWLVKQKAISAYQAEILTAGHSGPFRYGKYTVTDRFTAGLNAAGLSNDNTNFVARHTKTGHPVLLQFLAGTEPAHLKQWQLVEATTDTFSEIQHPNIAETYESVAAPNHRFVVSQLPTGSTLAEKLPRKARLPWKKSCAVLAQVANGLAHMHQSGVVHGAISPRTIWLEKNGLVQLRMNPIPDTEFDQPDPSKKGSESKFDYVAPEAYDDPKNISAASDLYSFGCTLVRAISGRTPFPEPDLAKKNQLVQNSPPPDLSQYEISDQLDSLLKQLLAKNPADRPTSAAEVGNLLGLLSGKADEIRNLSIPQSATKLAFRKSLKQLLPGSEQTSVAALPAITTDSSADDAEPAVDSEDSENLAQARREKIQAAAEAALKRKKGQWKIPAAIAGSLLAVATAIGIMALNADQNIANKTTGPESEITANATSSTNPERATIGTPATPAPLPVELRPTLLQQLIDDDNQTLWETPTSGTPVDFSYLPATPKLLFSFRPSELVAMDEGKRLIKSLGPKFEERIKQFENESGLDLDNIQQIVVSLHTNDEFEYEPYFVVQTTRPVVIDRLIQNWNRPSSRRLENQQEIYESADGRTAYFILSNQVPMKLIPAPEKEQGEDNNGTRTTGPTSEEVKQPEAATRFVFGNKGLVEEVALNAGGTLLPGSLRNIAEWTDRDRHINILFLRNALFNDEGQKLMGAELYKLNRELDVMIPDSVRGGLISLHLDSGNYFELMLDKTLDIKPDELKNIMVSEFRNQRDRLMRFVGGIPANPYWDSVRVRYGGMLADFYRNLRWNVEHDQVVANGWLPPMAAHNLFAASELVTSFASGATADAPLFTGPKSLEELLATKRDLNIANPPDLNVLLADLQQEINDDYGKLPFAFKIRLIGSDLEKGGITKNQRPGELNMSQKTLSEILTSIMTSANPSQDITGPGDPNCSLIWVVADDPDNPGQNAILVTTRDAAAAKSFELPPAFRTE